MTLRKPTWRSLAVLLCLALWPFSAHAQSPELLAAYHRNSELYAEGRYQEALPFAEKALTLSERELGPDDPTTAILLNNLARIYDDQGLYAETEPLYRRALANLEEALGPEHPNVAAILNNLAALYRAQGRYAEAEPLFQRALAIDEKTLGPEHPSLAKDLNNLAVLYDDQGLYAEAEPMYQRALAIREKTLGPEHPDVAASLNNLAELYRAQGRYAEAEPLSQRALAIKEKALGPQHPDVAQSFNTLAALYRGQGRHAAEAEPLLRRALAIHEKALGRDHPGVASDLNNLAGLYADQGRYAEAESLYRRALTILENAPGPEHPNVATSLNNLAELYNQQSRIAEALELARRATAVHRAREARSGAQRSGGTLSEQSRAGPVFAFHVELISRLAKDAASGSTVEHSALISEGFEVAQLARATAAARAVARMSARFGAGDDVLARTVRERQDAIERWWSLDARLIEAVSKPPDKRRPEADARLRDQIATLDVRLEVLDARLTSEFPEYAEIATPQPLTLLQAARLLGPEEALIAYFVDDEVTYFWVVRSNRAQMFRTTLGREALDDAVAELRGALDLTGIARQEDIPPFGTAKAYELYKRIFRPAEPLLDGVSHLMIVADAGLQSLPFGVLVAEEPAGTITDFADYRQVAWLAKKYAITVLPSVGSLRALRRFAKATGATDPFAGFGEPVLEGDPGGARGISISAAFSKGPVADVERIRRFPPLPETADELFAIAEALGASVGSIHLRDAATETRVKSMDLSNARVVAFATHALVAGELEGVAEPALVLPPPQVGTPADDGLLTASEVAQLELDADWVILSACNTAAGDKPGAEGLSGLAKAFFYAGSRALLVSHWPVVSDAATRLTTRMFAETAADPAIGRAEALRRSMLAMITDDKTPQYAHPLFWAPFSVVGEGG